jgi:L-threonylcarbamoyladenylate synthase
MKILNKIDSEFILAEFLAGKTFILPTETSYGLCCDATNQNATEKIFSIKGRRADKPLLVVVPTVAMAKQVLVWNETLEKIAKQYWPGPLTVVGDARLDFFKLAAGVLGKDGTVAVRVTADSFLSSLVDKLGRPMVATSGNISETSNIYDSTDVIAQFSGRTLMPDYLFSAGKLPRHTPTTIVSVVDDKLKIIRQGEIVVTV